MTTTVMANYSYGEDCFEEMPGVFGTYQVKKVVLIGGKRALASCQEEIQTILAQNEIKVTGTLVYGTDSTAATIQALIDNPVVQAADAIVGIGGGRAIDTSKMVASALGKNIFTVPTICSNCSAGTAIAVVYNEDHSLSHYGYPESPLHIFINTRVIAAAPTKYFWAGIADGISKAPEVKRASFEAEKRGQNLSHTAVLGRAVALSSENAFYEYAEQGLKDVENNRASKAVEEIALSIVVSTGYASNLVNQPDFYFNSAHAHAFYNGTTAVKREGEYLHGVVVSFGVMVLHAYYGEQEELDKVAQFNKKIGLPVTLAELGLTESDLPTIVDIALTTNECKNTPFTAEKFTQAILDADAYGHSLQ